MKTTRSKYYNASRSSLPFEDGMGKVAHSDIVGEQEETAILVGIITPQQNERKTKEYLDELEFLAETAGARTVKRFTQRLNGPSSVTYLGIGKLQEIRQWIEAEEDAERYVSMVIFDDELSAKQLRNIEKELKVKVLDRTSLILDIFAMRAQTANAKTQVELAQYRYMLPRLQRLWTHLERQGGGSGSGGGKGSVGLRGPGETQLEMDRRIILNRGIYQCGQVHADESPVQERGVCREQVVRHSRHHRAKGDCGQPPIPPL